MTEECLWILYVYVSLDAFLIKVGRECTDSKVSKVVCLDMSTGVHQNKYVEALLRLWMSRKVLNILSVLKYHFHLRVRYCIKNGT